MVENSGRANTLPLVQITHDERLALACPIARTVRACAYAGRVDDEANQQLNEEAVRSRAEQTVQLTSVVKFETEYVCLLCV